MIRAIVREWYHKNVRVLLEVFFFLAFSTTLANLEVAHAVWSDVATSFCFF